MEMATDIQWDPCLVGVKVAAMVVVKVVVAMVAVMVGVMVASGSIAVPYYTVSCIIYLPGVPSSSSNAIAVLHPNQILTQKKPPGSYLI